MIYLAPCVGYNELPEDIVLSVPVTFTDGKWSMLSDVTVGDKLKERLQLSASEIRRVCLKKQNKHAHAQKML